MGHDSLIWNSFTWVVTHEWLRWVFATQERKKKKGRVHTWHVPFIWDKAHSYSIWLIHMGHDTWLWDMIMGHETWRIHMWHDPLIWDTTHWYVTRPFHTVQASLSPLCAFLDFWRISEGNVQNVIFGFLAWRVFTPNIKTLCPLPSASADYFTSARASTCVDVGVFFFCTLLHGSCGGTPICRFTGCLLICIYIYVYRYLYVYLCLHTCTHTYIWVGSELRVWVRVQGFVRFICIHIDIYIYIYIFIYTYVYICVHFDWIRIKDLGGVGAGFCEISPFVWGGCDS